MYDLPALVRAILHSDVAQVRAIAQSAPELLLLHTSTGQTPLALAKDKGHKGIETALARQVDVTRCYTGPEVQQLLLDYLAEVSQDCMGAGWMEGLEFDVWAVLHQEPATSDTARWWHSCLTQEHVDDLAFLAQACDCWPLCPDGEAADLCLVPLAQWESHYQVWKVSQGTST